MFADKILQEFGPDVLDFIELLSVNECDDEQSRQARKRILREIIREDAGKANIKDGQILIAVLVDSSNGIYPLAYAIVEAECPRDQQTTSKTKKNTRPEGLQDTEPIEVTRRSSQTMDSKPSGSQTRQIVSSSHGKDSQPKGSQKRKRATLIGKKLEDIHTLWTQFGKKQDKIAISTGHRSQLCLVLSNGGHKYYCAASDGVRIIKRRRLRFWRRRLETNNQEKDKNKAENRKNRAWNGKV
ncbi:hypothetical protein Tco_1002119 [Tanacetum coccineum]|uniref:Uncharacterized protein n=1 Tax=Tanacetum coccineum TaxID=301880 RepID=A0ABQ5F5H5_9ASTR